MSRSWAFPPQIPHRGAFRAAPLAAEMRTIFGDRVADATQSDHLKRIYGRDLWPISFFWEKEGITPYPPDCIVWPENESEVIQLVQFCRRTKVPVVAYAGGSGVCGSAIPITGGIVCDMKKMDRVISLNETDLTCTVEPGMNGQLFEEYLNRHGYTLGHFPSSIYISTVGGWVATRAAGQLSTYYGKIEDMVLNMRIVLGTGEVAETLPAPRMAQGPDFNQIFTGSEGVLGIITGITFRIHPYPAHRGYFAVKAGSIGQGIELMRTVMRRGLKPAAVRLYDELDTAIIGSPDDEKEKHAGEEEKEISQFKKILSSVRKGKGLAVILKAAPVTNRVVNMAMKLMNTGCLLVFTFEGERKLIAPQLEIMEEISSDLKLEILGEKPARYWWNHRYDVSYNSPSVLKAGAFLDTCEVATTWEKLEELYDRVKDAIQNEVFIMAHFSHSYMNGNNIYFTFVGIDSDYESSRDKYFRVWDKIMKVCVEMNAAISHHHGVGLLKQKYMAEQMGPLLGIWQSVKKACDPDNIMNPGKMGL